MPETWEIYEDKKTGEWRWKHKAANRKIIGASTEGYKNREDCLSNAYANGYGTITADFSAEPFVLDEKIGPPLDRERDEGFMRSRRIRRT